MLGGSQSIELAFDSFAGSLGRGALAAGGGKAAALDGAVVVGAGTIEDEGSVCGGVEAEEAEEMEESDGFGAK